MLSRAVDMPMWQKLYGTLLALSSVLTVEWQPTRMNRFQYYTQTHNVREKKKRNIFFFYVGYIATCQQLDIFWTVNSHTHTRTRTSTRTGELHTYAMILFYQRTKYFNHIFTSIFRFSSILWCSWHSGIAWGRWRVRDFINTWLECWVSTGEHSIPSSGRWQNFKKPQY